MATKFRDGRVIQKTGASSGAFAADHQDKMPRTVFEVQPDLFFGNHDSLHVEWLGHRQRTDSRDDA